MEAIQTITPPNGSIIITCRECRGKKVVTDPDYLYHMDITDDCLNIISPAIVPCTKCKGKGEYPVKNL